MPESEQPSPSYAELHSELLRLNSAANHGDEEARRRLGELLDTHPIVWEQAGNMERQAFNAWSMRISASNPLLCESLARKVAAMTSELEGDAPTRLEKLLVERILICWLQLTYYEILATQSEEQSIKQAEFSQKRLNLTQKRYLAAIRALAQVRHLLPIAVASRPVASDDPTTGTTATATGESKKWPRGQSLGVR